MSDVPKFDNFTNDDLKFAKYCEKEKRGTFRNNYRHKLKYKERYKNYARNYHKNERNQKQGYNNKLLRNFGISPEQYEQMLLLQNNKCAICNKEETRVQSGKITKLCLDHCHKTGKVRELLCYHCNASLGLCNENITTLDNAIKYLLKYANTGNSLIDKNNYFKHIPSSDSKRQVKNYKLKQNFGITIFDYEAILKTQNGVCEICLQIETKTNGKNKIQSLGVDHCHKTNKIRGLLCHSCNMLIGYLNENIETLNQMIAYIEKWGI